MRVVCTLLALVLLLIGYARPAFAQEAPIVLQVQGDESFEHVRDAFHGKLGTTFVTAESANARRLSVQVDDTVVTVTFRDEKGRETARTVRAATKASVLDTAAILAENLVTDQTAALLAQQLAENEQNAKEPKKPAAAAVKRPWHPAVVSLVYPVASNMGKPNVLTHFSLDALYGHVGAIDGLQLSGLVGQVEGPVYGLQIGGLATYSGEDVGGLQLAGLGGYAKGAVHGLQVTGIAGYAKEGVHGLQIAGIAAVAPGGVDGMQIAPVSVAGDVNGAQIGVVNIGGKVKGTQIGVVNISDDLDGVALGVVNYSKTGRLGAIAWSSNHGFGNVGVKYMTKYTYTVVRGTYTHEHGADFMGPGFNFGVHLPVARPLFVDIDFGTAWLFKTSSNKATDYDDHQARLLVGAELADRVSLFGGGGLDVQVERKDQRDVRFSPVFSAGVQVAY